jgi:hypothetical protein
MLNVVRNSVWFRPYLLSTVLVGLALTSCGSNTEGTLTPPGTSGGVTRLSAPVARSMNEISTLNSYRSQAFSVLASNGSSVNHSNILYTAAYRHSVFLNTVNSANYDPITLRGIPGSTVTGSSSTDELRDEKVVSQSSGSYPAYATAVTPWNRVNAVQGGAGLLSQLMGEGIKEYYLFDGDIPKSTGSTTGSGSGSTSSEGEHLRGFSTADTTALIDNLWYSRKGRFAMLRPNLLAIGVGQPTDSQLSGVITPPWPFLDGRFQGTVTCAYGRADQKLLSVWPKDGSTTIRTMGVDTDIAKLVNVSSGLSVDAVVPHSYGGPPITVTLPINVPFLLNPTNVVGGVTVGFRKLEVDPLTGSAQAPPASMMSTYIMVMFAMPVSSSSGSATQVVFSSVSQATDTRYQFGVVGSTTTTTSTGTGTGAQAQDDNLRFGDLVLIPTGPLEPSSWYEVAVRLRSTAPSPWDDFPGTQEEKLETPASGVPAGWVKDGYYQFRFKTR